MRTIIAGALLVALVTVSASAVAADSTIEERIDLFDPNSGAFLGSEQTWFGPDGRRLRWLITDARGKPSLLFFLLHDDRGRESQAIYFEDGSTAPDREVFSYSDDGRLQTTTYYDEPGEAGERTVSEVDGQGRELRKRYYRADASKYGEEEVFWNEDGTKAGWDFSYVGREGGAQFRYRYERFDEEPEWTQRTRMRNGVEERREVRTQTRARVGKPSPTPVAFAPGSVSTSGFETSPSFSADGKTMVFARYGDDWTTKEPFIAFLQEDGWRVEPLGRVGPVYNLAISPDASAIVYATRRAEQTKLFRIRLTPEGWSKPEDLTHRYGLKGAYPCLTEDGDLLMYHSDGAEGAGIYLAPADGMGFGPAKPLFVPASGTPFDAHTLDGNSLLATRCFDDVCESGPENGIWFVTRESSGETRASKLADLPYAWGAQPVPALGVFVFTDGEDVMALPLERVRYK